MMTMRTLVAMAFAIGISAGCGGGQTHGEAFDTRWADDHGATIAEFQRHFASMRVPLGADVAVGVIEDQEASGLVLMLVRNAKLIGMPLTGGPKWTYSHPLGARPAVAGTVVVGLGRGELFALDARTGKLLWKRNAGGKLRGVGDDGRTTVVSLMSTTGKGSVILAINHDGEVMRQIEDDAAIGVPAVVDRYVFLPWAGQYVTVFDLQTGQEVARALLRSEVSRAFVLGGSVFFGGLGVTRLDENIGFASQSRASTVMLPDRDLPGEPLWMSPGLGILEATATAADKVKLYARPTARGNAGIDSQRYVDTYFQIAVGLDATSGHVAWAHSASDDLLGAAAYSGGFALCDASGTITFLNAEHGTVAGKFSLGNAVHACVVQADGISVKPKGEPEPLWQQLSRIVMMTAAQNVPIQKMLLQELSVLEDDGVTKTLIDLVSSDRTPQILQKDAQGMLAKRKTGVQFMLQALEQHVDYLKDVTRPPPVGPLADALAALNETRAAPLLVSHLNDPATPPDDLQRAATALETLAGPEQLAPLTTFFALYRSTSDEALANTVVSVAKALARIGGNNVVTHAMNDPYTSPQIKKRLETLASGSMQSENKKTAAAGSDG